MDTPPADAITVIGIGADGWEGLNPLTQQGILDADVVLGGERHLAMLPPAQGQERAAWPSPLRAGLPGLLASYDGRRVVALASGDPLVSGIGSTLIDMLGAERVRVEPALSSIALARARMGWADETAEVISLVGRDAHAVLRSLSDRHRLLLLCADGDTAATVAGLITGHGFGDSLVTALCDLGSPGESRLARRAADWSGRTSALTVLAVECAGAGWGWAPGLPDEAFEHDGQLTKRDARAAALARLAPAPGHLLWDVGAGAGSVGIEWLRTHPSTRAIAIEGDLERAMRIGRNALELGVPRLEVVTGRAPGALAVLSAPDAAFVGGGATREGVLDTVVEALRPGGRLVVHGVTLETEAVLRQRYAGHGGELTRLQVETAAPLGGLTGWTPARAITQWAWRKDS